MPGLSTLPLPLALWLLSGGGAGTPAELPGGNGSAFRTRMLGWSEPAPEPQWPAPPVRRTRPAPLPRFSSGFGPRSDPIHGARAIHKGVDIPGTSGTPVQASAAGVVRFAGVAGGYGRMIELDHGGGLATRYGHLSQLLVARGTPVAQGETIALMGATGRATGPHLHFEVRTQGRAVNPLGYLNGSAEPAAAPAPALTAEPHISAFARARDAQRDWQACLEVLCVAP